MPVVVELFTSQGCSSCPPVDAMLTMLAGRADVLPLSYHVDYWDYLGWADSFARPEFTARQEAYARAWGERAVYTPQLIIDGSDTTVAPGPAQLMSLIEAHQMMPVVLNLQRERQSGADVIELTPLSDLGQRLDVVLVRFLPERQVEMTRGENAGRTVTYSNIVLSLELLTRWDGRAPLRLTVRTRAGDSSGLFPEDTRHVILVQQMRAGTDMPGPIVGAVALD